MTTARSVFYREGKFGRLVAAAAFSDTQVASLLADMMDGIRKIISHFNIKTCKYSLTKIKPVFLSSHFEFEHRMRPSL